MKVYIAASFSARERLRPVREQLFRLGYDVTSSWLDEIAKPSSMDQATFDRNLAVKDLVEAASADILIQDTLTMTTTGGSDVEWGVSLGRFQRQARYVVGPVKSIFHRLADYIFSTWEDALLALIPPSTAPPTSILGGPERQEAKWIADTAWLEKAVGEYND